MLPNLYARIRRLPRHNYASTRWYFVTTNAAFGTPVLSRIRGSRLTLTPLGRAVDRAWHGIAAQFPMAATDSYVIMPDHFHGLISPNLRDPRARVPLPVIVAWFKQRASHEMNALLGTRGAVRWHVGYWESVIRDEVHLRRVRRYIANNPRRAKKWDEGWACAGEALSGAVGGG